MADEVVASFRVTKAGVRSLLDRSTGDAVSEEPAAQLAALEGFVQRTGRPSMAAPISLYLDQVREFLTSERDCC